MHIDLFNISFENSFCAIGFSNMFEIIMNMNVSGVVHAWFLGSSPVTQWVYVTKWRLVRMFGNVEHVPRKFHQIRNYVLKIQTLNLSTVGMIFI